MISIVRWSGNPDYITNKELRLPEFMRGLEYVFTHALGRLNVVKVNRDTSVYTNNGAYIVPIGWTYIEIEASSYLGEKYIAVTDDDVLGKLLFDYKQHVADRDSCKPARKNWDATQKYMQWLTNCTDTLNAIIANVATQEQVYPELLV